jgi:hypothetical protein
VDDADGAGDVDGVGDCGGRDEDPPADDLDGDGDRECDVRGGAGDGFLSGSGATGSEPPGDGDGPSSPGNRTSAGRPVCLLGDRAGEANDDEELAELARAGPCDPGVAVAAAAAAPASAVGVAVTL